VNLLAEPLGFEFFRQGLIASGLVGALCGMLGVYIVLRRMSYIGHGLSHSVFGGAVVGYVLSLNFYLAAGLWGFLSALAINATARRRRIGADAAIGIVTTASFAVGVALISRTRSFTRNFEAALFGNILGVDGRTAWYLFALGLASLLALATISRPLLFASLDEAVARARGLPVEALGIAFLVLAMGAYAFIEVGGGAIAKFGEWRNGKAELHELKWFFVIGVVVLVCVVYLLTTAGGIL